MKVEDTPLINLIREKHEFKFGNAYFFDFLIITEIYEGVIFDWDMVVQIEKKKRQFFTVPNNKISFISNRINSYSIKTENWVKYLKDAEPFENYAIVTHRRTATTNIAIEQVFYKGSIFSFESLFEAVNFIRQRRTLDTLITFDDLKKSE